MRDLGNFTYMGEWYLPFITFLVISILIKWKDLESRYLRMVTSTNASSKTLREMELERLNTQLDVLTMDR